MLDLSALLCDSLTMNTANSTESGWSLFRLAGEDAPERPVRIVGVGVDGKPFDPLAYQNSFQNGHNDMTEKTALITEMTFRQLAENGHSFQILCDKEKYAAALMFRNNKKLESKQLNSLQECADWLRAQIIKTYPKSLLALSWMKPQVSP